MNNGKKMTIIFVSIIIVLFFVIFLINKIRFLKDNNKNEISSENIFEDENKIDDVGDVGYEPEVTNKEEEVTDIVELKTVEQCIQIYYDTLNYESSFYYDQVGNRDVSDEQINDYLLELLDENYKTKNNINKDNFNKYIEKVNESYIVIPLKMKKVLNVPIEKYLTYGLLVNSEYTETKEFYIYTNINSIDKTFSIEPVDGNDLDFDKLMIENNNKQFEKNDKNQYEVPKMGASKIAEEYFRRNKILSLANSEVAYKYLDDDYKNKRFGNYEKYQVYIDENRKNIMANNISQYQVKNDGIYMKYVCIDQNDNYFIVDQESALHYRVFLDIYTIDDSEFKDKYDKGDNQTKGGMNIEKVKMALNAQDYNYVYSKLDSTFKKNNFDTIEKFEDYCKDNFYNSCNFEYIDYEERGNGIYTFKVQMVSDEEGNNGVQNITFIMQLKDDRDFVMSFSFN